MSNQITLVGAGLVGSLLAVFLARRGFNVEIFERRPDMRKETISAGRSINLAISTRGINALKKLGIDQDVLQFAIPMPGRMIHPVKGELVFQPYGKDETEYINSMSRGKLNMLLMDYAEQTGRVSIKFDQRVAGMDFDRNMLLIHDQKTGKDYEQKVTRVIGTDGSASAIRRDMMLLPGYEAEEKALEYGYKELTLPAGGADRFQIAKNALHIWPRNTYMLIALPNLDGSFTCTLFLPFEGKVSFAKLKTDQDVRHFFSEQFPDVVPLFPDLTENFFGNQTGHMVTVKTHKWNVGGDVLLMGDAAHGIVPFFGQGMNCGFEDCTVLDQCLFEFEGRYDSIDWSDLFDRFVSLRKANTDAIADMAVENFVEMRDKVADPRFLMAKGVEKIFQNTFPGRYVSRYSLVTFSNVPYTVAAEAGLACEEILTALCSGIEKPDQVDLALADKLIEAKLTPVLNKHATTNAEVRSYISSRR